ncbi:hypothetical protein [Helicobacter typhlonius]|uniref:Histidine kinase n=4 Tax=Helicobacter typhlonius TaxID=76936 RepID=A0A0S4PUF6_9HELI|nr:hypothetical protein [Helicobacter typhlonius]CUU39885.1 FIG00710474: Hypothetical protein [Helicobacter typhlonius]CUU39893.1 FIG00710474: Hypothetical protein [Helicobacter typhlonius]CUU39901.1 FIG00710474: Hypothetical protein [Helicobacter typhlonius]
MLGTEKKLHYKICESCGQKAQNKRGSMEAIKLTDIRTRREVNKNNKRAFALFIQKQYKQAFELFSHNLQLDSENTESLIGLLLADMAQDFEEQALGIYEYYQILLSQEISKTKARAQILKTIQSLDKSTNKIFSFLRGIENLRADAIDGILYQDFKRIAKDNFKRAFEDLIFSTKIIFTNKGDFYEFLNQLVENDYQDMSLEYIESLKKNIMYDKEFEKILQKVGNDIHKKHKA